MAPALAAAAKAGSGASKKQQAKAKQKELTAALQAVQKTVRAGSEAQDLLQQHFAAFASFNKAGLEASISFCHAAALQPEQRDAAWRLFEANMASIYAADAQKWSPREKQRELFHDEARWFLVTDATGKLLAFLHFRFEVEENLLAPEEMAALRLGRYDSVVYCYELQLDAAVHRKGLGRRLMQLLELTALKFGAHMVMLTVQRSNAGAAAFYASLGYRQHPSCPARNGFEDFDGVDPGHRIMFKDLRRS